VSSRFRRVAASFGALLRRRGLPADDLIAIRNSLHPEDISADFRDIDDVIGTNALSMYDRMQDGPRRAGSTI
jgi:hypothetical protein